MSTAPIAQGPVDVNVSRHFGEEKFNLHILRYMDGDGLPTCAADFPSGRVCIFYATQRFGCNETCWFAEKTGKRWHVLRRRKNGEGTLIPDGTFCPVWANAELWGEEPIGGASRTNAVLGAAVPPAQAFSKD